MVDMSGIHHLSRARRSTATVIAAVVCTAIFSVGTTAHAASDGRSRKREVTRSRRRTGRRRSRPLAGLGREHHCACHAPRARQRGHSCRQPAARCRRLWDRRRPHRFRCGAGSRSRRAGKIDQRRRSLLRLPVRVVALPRCVRSRHPHGQHHRRQRRYEAWLPRRRPGSAHRQRQGWRDRWHRRRVAGDRRHRLDRAAPQRSRPQHPRDQPVVRNRLTAGLSDRSAHRRRRVGVAQRDRRGRLRWKRRNRATSLTDPATDPYVLAVGAADIGGTSGKRDDRVAEFSGRGNAARSVDVVAPGSVHRGAARSGLDDRRSASRSGGRRQLLPWHRHFAGNGRHGRRGGPPPRRPAQPHARHGEGDPAQARRHRSPAPGPRPGRRDDQRPRSEQHARHDGTSASHGRWPPARGRSRRPVAPSTSPTTASSCGGEIDIMGQPWDGLRLGPAVSRRRGVVGRDLERFGVDRQPVGRRQLGDNGVDRQVVVGQELVGRTRGRARAGRASRGRVRAGPASRGRESHGRARAGRLSAGTSPRRGVVSGSRIRRVYLFAARRSRCCRGGDVVARHRRCTDPGDPSLGPVLRRRLCRLRAAARPHRASTRDPDPLAQHGAAHRRPLHPGAVPADRRARDRLDHRDGDPAAAAIQGGRERRRVLDGVRGRHDGVRGAPHARFRPGDLAGRPAAALRPTRA